VASDERERPRRETGALRPGRERYVGGAHRPLQRAMSVWTGF
jgi:hypothetical protein